MALRVPMPFVQICLKSKTLNLLFCRLQVTMCHYDSQHLDQPEPDLSAIGCILWLSLKLDFVLLIVTNELIQILNVFHELTHVSKKDTFIEIWQ